MAELGESQDPQQLVPGKPEAIEENSRVLWARATQAADAAQGLRAIDTGAWEGPGAQAFHDKFSYEPGKWFAAADSLQAAASALDSYSATLRWAQAQATEAIQLWNQGQAVTQQAKAQHDQAAAQAAAQNQPISPFADPGEASRQAARDALNRARTQLNEAGDDAATALRDATERAPQDSSWLDDVGNFLGDVGAHIVNDVASFGNALLHHPEDVGSALFGLGLTVASGAGMAGGAALTATVEGAVVGVPLMGASAMGAAEGVGTMTAAIGDLASHAGGDDRLQPIKTNESKASSDVTEEALPASAEEAKPLQTNRRQLEAKFKHAKDFGVETPRGKQGFDDFDKALKEFANDSQTVTKGGTYRGEPAILRYNPDSGLVLVQKPDGTFVSGWKMTESQLEYVSKYGSLGGGE